MSRQIYVYIMASRTKRLYVGVTNNLERRVYEHKNHLSAFTARYRMERLVYYEETGDVSAAIEREKQLKGWLRARKVALIESLNPGMGRPDRVVVSLDDAERTALLLRDPKPRLVVSDRAAEAFLQVDLRRPAEHRA